MHDTVALLDITDSNEMIELAWDYRTEWRFIGRNLGIDDETLKAIEDDYRRVRDRLTEVINLWLKNNTPRPTRGALLAVLQSVHVFRNTGTRVAV